MRITDATSVSDRIDKAMREEFYLSKYIPIPTEIDPSLKVMTTYGSATLTRQWGRQLEDLRALTNECEGARRIWGAMAPPSIRAAMGNMKTATLAHLAEPIGLGGGKWVRQFTYGSPLVEDLSQSGVYPRKEDPTPAPSVTGLWGNASARFQERSAHSGMANAAVLWEEACEQVKKRWLGAPLPIDTLGNVATYEKGKTNIAFRFGVAQGDKLRAFDDLRHNCVNLRCTVWIPNQAPDLGSHLSDVLEHERPSGKVVLL